MESKSPPIRNLDSVIKIEKAGPSHKPSLFLTALGAVLFGRRHSASMLVSSPHKRRPDSRYSTPKNKFVNVALNWVVVQFEPKVDLLLGARTSRPH
jgi:hypothetical protein